MGKWLPTIVSTALVVAMCGFVFFMSDRPSDESGAMSMEIVRFVVAVFVPDFDQLDPAEQLARAKAIEHIVRKTAHFSEFAVLGALSLNLMLRLSAVRAVGKGACAPSLRSHLASLGNRAKRALIGKSILASGAFSVLYACTDEFHQQFVEGRACLVYDVAIDSAGALFGIAVLAIALLVSSSRVGSNRGIVEERAHSEKTP